MPRARKTMAGQPAQKINAIKGQEYGQGVVQEKLQRAMPAPATQTKTPPPQPSQPTPAQEVAPAPRPRLDPAALRQHLQGMGGILRRPDDRPDQRFDVTITDPAARINMGFAPPVNRLGEQMRELSRRTGDPTFADLAAKAGY